MGPGTKIHVFSNRLREYRPFRLSSKDPMQVVCPSCGNKGLIFPLSTFVKRKSPGALFICAVCELAKTALKGSKTFYWDDALAPTDAFFHFPLWMQTECVGNTLWAFNFQHLQTLMYAVAIEADTSGVFQLSDIKYAHALKNLPRWIVAEENRASVADAIETLKDLGRSSGKPGSS